MSIVAKSIMQKLKKSNTMNDQSIIDEKYARTLKVISLCSVCGEPVFATKHDKAIRHGFKRYKKQRLTSISQTPTKTFSQEDDMACPGSGEEVIYKRCRNYKKIKI